MEESRTRKIFVKTLSLFVIVVVAWIFISTLIGGWDRIKDYNLSPNAKWLAALLLFVAAVAVSGLLWGSILRSLSSSVVVRSTEAVRSHLAGWVMRYIPGGVGSFLYKLTWAQKRGISKTIAVIGFAYENIFLQLASFVGGTIVLITLVGPKFLEDNLSMLLLLTLFLCVLVILVSKPVMKPVLLALSRGKLREKILDIPMLPSGRSLLYVLEFLGPRTINGIGVALVASALFRLEPETLWIIGAAYAIAGALGLLAFFVPGGVGVREGSFVLILAATGFEVVDAVFLSILIRFLATIADLIIAGIFGLLTLSKRSLERGVS